MTRPTRYSIPAKTHRVEETILRSRFITTVGHAATVEEAREFVSSVAAEFEDANHNCWAFVVGPPGDTSRVGMSDDGEPHGTAGRPMLSVLLGSDVGDIVAVVTRYFGGTKLGKGGLVRAYSGGVKLALDELPVEELVQRTSLRVTVDYPALEAVQRALTQFEAESSDESYGTDVAMTVVLPTEHVEAFRKTIAGITNGRAVVEIA